MNSLTTMKSGTVVCSTIVILLTIASAANAAVYVANPDRLWPGGVVPVVWDPDISFGNHLSVVVAMNFWSDVANVTFVPRTNETDYVFIQNASSTGPSNSQFIGRNGDEQKLTIRQDLTNLDSHGLAHEVGHVLGYFHAHQRQDWISIVTIYWNRIDTCKIGNFTQASNSLAYPRNRMDYDSVMTYPECTFSNCGLLLDPTCSCTDSTCTTWTRQDCNLAAVVCCRENRPACRTVEIIDTTERSQWQSELGQRDHLSKLDALTMSFLYPEPNWRFLEKNYSPSDEIGTFHNPYVNLSSALDETPNGGILWIQPATYNNPTTTITSPVLLRAPLGGVVIR